MLVLSRKCNQDIIVNGNIRIHVVSISGNTVRLGIDAPKDVGILRGELVSANDNSESLTVVTEASTLQFSVDVTPDIS